MWLNEEKTLFMPNAGWLVVKTDPLEDGSYPVVELSALEKQTLCPILRVPTGIATAGGQPGMRAEVVMPRSVFLVKSATGIVVGEISILGNDHGLAKVDDVLAWVFEDDRLRPEPMSGGLDS